MLLVALSLVAIRVYLPPYHQAFIGDDYVQLGYIAQFLDSPFEAWRVFDPFWTAWYFRPLQNLWLLACRLVFGLNPFGYYFLQGLWHAFAGATVFALARRLGLRRPAAALSMAIFLINSHHHDVVSWLSSIAAITVTVFSLLTVVFYLRYLQQEGDTRWLLAAALTVIGAMISHEEAVLLPITLLLARLMIWRTKEFHRIERLFAVAILATTVIAGSLHFLRPNNTIALHNQSIGEWLPALWPAELSDFIVTIFGRWLLLNKTSLGTTVLSSFLGQRELAVGAAMLIVASLIYGYWRGQGIVRLSILWLVTHLGFYYLALWQQKPDLFAGRHLYSSWVFVSLALAWAAHRFVQRKPYRDRKRVVAALLALFLAWNLLLVGDDQHAWQQHATAVAEVEQQMKALMPQVTPRTQVFVHRFILTPSFAPFAAAVWYNQPHITGGSLDKMQTQDWYATDSYLFDYHQGQLVNILPGLQRHPRSAILWDLPQTSVSVQPSPADSPATVHYAQIAGPEGDRRIGTALILPQQGWLSLAYEVTPDAGKFVETAFLGSEGTSIRVRVRMLGGSEKVEVRKSIGAEEAGRWQQLRIPLLAVDNQPVQAILLEVRGPSGANAFWSLPRLILQ